MTKRRILTTAALAVTLGGALVLPAAGSVSASTGDLGPRLERACLRLPNIEERTANVIARLEGDASVRGSLLWLQVQIDKANERGRTDLAEVLTNRLAVREQTLDVMKQRQEELPALIEFCISRGVPL